MSFNFFSFTKECDSCITHVHANATCTCSFCFCFVRFCYKYILYPASITATIINCLDVVYCVSFLVAGHLRSCTHYETMMQDQLSGEKQTQGRLNSSN